MTLTILLVSFAVLIFLRVPVAFSMGVSAVLAIVLGGKGLPLELIPQRMYVMIDSSSLLAIPFFILAGELMEQGGLSARMIRFAQSLVGHWRGGLAQVAVLANTIFSALTGSSAAAASAIGSIMIPAMKEKGYPAAFAASINASAASIGPIIPPSIIMVVYGSITGVSVSAMFMAGIVPGLIIAAGLMALNWIYAYRNGWGSEPRQTIGQIIKSFSSSIWALLAPVIIIGGIIGGIFTPTEAGAVAVVYAGLVARFVYHELPMARLKNILSKAAYSTGMVAFIMASAGIFGWLLAVEQVPQTVVSAILSVTDTPGLAILLVIAIVLVIGAVVEVTAAVVLIVPVFYPLGQALGFNDVHFGIILCVALVFGNVTPPVGLLLYITSAISGSRIGEIMRYQWSSLVVLVTALLIVTYSETITLMFTGLLK